MKVLITGISSVIGRLVTQRLLAEGHQVVGIDRRPWSDAPENVEVFRSDVRKRATEDVFRVHRPQAVVHMATVSHLQRSTEDRYRINMHGTRAIFHHCDTYGVEHAVFVGRHTYYGAAPDSPLYHQEDSPPMASTTFPELADLVAADLYAGQALWRYPDLKTAVLRFCYELGPAHHATLASYLKGPKVPTILGFDPLFQFMHEYDIAGAIVAALEKRIHGVYNVSGPDPIPLSLLIQETGRKNLYVPEPLFRLALGRFGLPRLPQGAVDHIKYPVVIDGKAFREATGFHHLYDEDDTMIAFRSSDGLTI